MHFRRMLPLVALAMLASPTICFAAEGHPLSSTPLLIAFLVSWIMVFIWSSRFLRRKSGSAIVGTGGGFIASIIYLILVGSIFNYQDNQVRIEQEQQAKAQAAVVAAKQKKVEEAQEKVRETQRAAERKVEEARCRTDLQCWGDKNTGEAEVFCKGNIERLAKYQAEWTDGWLESKFSRFRWKDETRGIVTYFGDKIKFQNGFGAWQIQTYQCDYDTKNETALAVRVEPGRLS